MNEDPIERMLGPETTALHREARRALDRLVSEAERIEAPAALREQARTLRAHVDEFFLLVVVGEVKSGKSSFINALLGEEVQEEGPLPLTDRIWVLRHGEERGARPIADHVWERTHPNERLRWFHIVDTPGTNSIVREHQAITESFVPRSDLVLFVTSIDRPFSESEHRFLDYVAERWRKKVLFVLTKIDTHPPEDVPVVQRYIEENCRRFYGFTPRVFPISAAWARRARESGDEELLRRSGLPALEEFFSSEAARLERVRLKLESPIASALTVLDDLEGELRRRAEILERDFRALEDLDRQVEQRARELSERHQAYVVRVYDLLREFERRGKVFLEEEIRVRNLGLLRKPEAFQRRFVERVVADLETRIEEQMHAATDWLVREQIGLYDRALRFLGEQPAVERYGDRVAAAPPEETGFEYRRDRLVESIREAWKRELERFDVEAECRQLTEEAYRTVLKQLGLQAGAVGLGAVLVAVLSGALLDVTGILAAGALFAGGFVLLPRRKRQAIHRFSLKVDDLIREFRAAMEEAFDKEIRGSVERLRGAWEPYRTFHRAEAAAIEEQRRGLAELRAELRTLLGRVESLGATSGSGAQPKTLHEKPDGGRSSSP